MTFSLEFHHEKGQHAKSKEFLETQYAEEKRLLIAKFYPENGGWVRFLLEMLLNNLFYSQSVRIRFFGCYFIN